MHMLRQLFKYYRILYYHLINVLGFLLNEGHYLSASAQMWASTHNVDLQEKMSAVVSALSDCQNKIGTGYLSAFPPELFDRFESLKEVWAPYYTIHKVQTSNYSSNAF